MNKKFEDDSVYEKYDLDHDGVISDDELAHAKITKPDQTLKSNCQWSSQETSSLSN